MALLEQRRIAIIATDGVEESELVAPLRALKNAGAQVDILAPHEGSIQAFQHHNKSILIPVDRVLNSTVLPEEYDALLLPGGALNSDALRFDPRVIEFVRAIDECEKPLAVICHAPWILISAGLVKDRRMTSFQTIQDDLRNAGAIWQESEVVVDNNLVTSRKPADIPVFIQEFFRLLSKKAPLISEETRRVFAKNRIA